jgi:4-aminobutyrate aminotransferase-like enzyme
MKRLEELTRKHELIGEVRGKGLMVGVELVKNHGKKEPATAETSKVRELCREKGVLIGHGGVLGNVLRIQPPLIISRDDLDVAVDVIDKCLAEVQ